MTIVERRVVFITGASSGIGKATAIAFARDQSKMVLCGRDAPALQRAATECRSYGAETLTCIADVSVPGAIETARDQAVAAFERIDVWINCAAVISFGPFETLPRETFNHIIETNIYGYADGSRAALSQFRNQGNRGTLINVSSLLGVMGEPYVSAYVATKFAIRGLTACLRQEMRDFPELHVCCVLPPAVDTPIYQKAGNLMGKRSRAIYPVYSPEHVASRIRRAVDHPRREIVVGSLGHFMSFANRLAPMLLERMIARLAPLMQFETRPESETEGNIFRPMEPHAINGGWRQYWKAKLFERTKPD